MSHKTKSATPDAAEIKQLSPETGRMLDVITALIPAAFAGIAVFGIRAAAVIAVTVISSVLFEHLYCVIKKTPTTVGDLSAVVTGLILAFSLPVKVPLYIPVFGSAVAVIAVKLLFGGKGKNFLNPALTARAALLIAFIPSLTKFTVPARNPVDAVSCATPLKVLSQLDISGDVGAQIVKMVEDGELPGLVNMLFGVKAGCIGEVCAIALILGGIYLILRGVISFAVPVAYIASFTLCTFIFSGFSPLYTLYFLLSGSVIFAAFFIATDPVTSPDTLKKKLIFGALAGIITAVIRFYTPLAEGVTAAVLLMNLTVFLLKKIPVLKARISAKKEENSEFGMRNSEEPEEANSEAENEPSIVGDGVPDIPPDSTEPTEETSPDIAENDAQENSDFGMRNSEEPEEANSEAENEPSIVGDDVPDISPDSTEPTEETSPEIAENDAQKNSDFGMRNSEEPEEANSEAENEPSAVGDDAPGVPQTEAPETKAPADKPLKPVFVNELSSDTQISQEKKKSKKQGRKAKKKQKQMPDFSEPIPEVIPEFLKKEIEKQKSAKSE